MNCSEKHNENYTNFNLHADVTGFVKSSLLSNNPGNSHNSLELHNLTLNLPTTTIVAPPSNASKWQMGFNSAFKGLNMTKINNNKVFLPPPHVLKQLQC